MSDTIKLKHGKGTVPRLSDNELGYSTDTKELHIGSASGNETLCRAGDNKKIDNHEQRIARLEGKVFYAIYGETNGADIDAALKDGKFVICKVTTGDHTGRMLYLSTDWMTGNGFTFTNTDANKIIAAEVIGDYWSITAYKLVTTE